MNPKKMTDTEKLKMLITSINARPDDKIVYFLRLFSEYFSIYADPTLAGNLANFGIECRDFGSDNLSKELLDSFQVVFVDVIDHHTGKYYNFLTSKKKIIFLKEVLALRYASTLPLFINLTQFENFFRWFSSNTAVNFREIREYYRNPINMVDKETTTAVLLANEKSKSSILLKKVL